MDLYIRSQDKTRLIKVFDVYITGNYENIIRANFKEHFSGCEYIDLGEYVTKERALEVLDEIQNILIDYKEMSRVVYQMPEE